MAGGLSKWLVYSDEGFAPAVVRATLRPRGEEEDVPIEFVRFEAEPSGFVDVELNTARSTERELYLEVFPQADLLQSNHHFYDTVWSMSTGDVTVTVWAKPSDPKAKNKTEKHANFTVNIKPPLGQVYWYDWREPSVRLPDPIEVKADGEDEFTLGVWCSLWLPQGPPASARPAPRLDPEDVAHPVQGPSYQDRGQFGFDPSVIEFTHYTGPQFDEDIFGPSDDSKPWIMAQPGTNEDRSHSKWRSRTPLPDEAKWPSHIPPIDDIIRTRAWVSGHITARRVNEVDARSKFLGEAEVPVRLGAKKAAVIGPSKPIPADGKSHDVELEFVEADDRSRPIEKGRFRLELDRTGDVPGGTIEPEIVVLSRGDGGRATVRWTTPDLEYKPGTRYDQPLKVFWGEGEEQVVDSPVTMWCNPALNLLVDGNKCGLDWDPQYIHPEVVAGKCPAEVSVHLGARFREPFRHIQVREDAFDAEVEISVDSDGTTHELKVATRTDDQGRVQFELPEVAAGWAARTDGGDTRPTLELLRFRDQPPSSLENRPDRPRRESPRAALGSVAGVFDGNKALFERLLLAPTRASVDQTGFVLSTHLAAWPEADCSKAVHGTNLVSAALQGAVQIDATQKAVVEQMFEKFFKAFWAFFSVLLKFVKMGKLFSKVPFVGKALERAYRHALARLLVACRGLMTRVASDVSRIVARKMGSVVAGRLNKLLTEASKLLGEGVDMASELGGEASVKARLRGTIGDLAEDIDLAVAAALARIESGAYANSPENIPRYFRELAALNRNRPDLDLDMSWYESLISEIGSFTTNCALAGMGLLALGVVTSLTGIGAGAGVPVAGAGAALLTMSGPTGLMAAVAGGLVFGYGAAAQLSYAWKLSEEYKRLTAEMVGG